MMDGHYIPAIHPKKCCVKNCLNRISKRHRFPKKYPEVFRAWIEVIKPPNYENLSVEEIYNKYYVCEDHFDSTSIVSSRNKRGLKVNAVPTLKIPAQNISPDMPNTLGTTVLLSPRKQKITTPISIQSPRAKRKLFLSSTESLDVTSISNVIALPSTSKQIITPIQSPREKGKALDIPSTFDTNVLSTPKHQIFTLAQSPNVGKRKALRKVTARVAKKKYLLRDINVSRSSELTPKAKALYHTLSAWGSKIGNMDRRIKSYQERLSIAEHFVSSPNFSDLLKYINHPTYKFVMCQVRNQRLKPRGRRYTLDEKILALTIFKSSGKGYRFLSKLFSLPTPGTLRILLGKIPLRAGINNQIFESLSHKVRKMKSAQEKRCILMFDELSIDTNLTYDKKNDKVVGLEDYGTDRRAVIADHANVFFLKGIYKQWRQPLAFTFSSGPVKSIKLKGLIKNVILECQKIGLQVIATVCDQGCTNQSAIKMLLEETKEYFLSNNEENPNFGFLVNNQEVVPLFDVPHLFKGIRNNLLTKDLHFVINGEEKIAKWSHIIKFYELDVSDPSLRLCSKLTDQHVMPDKINKMKVKCCTQVFSHTVGALMKRVSRWDTQDNYNLGPDASDTADLLLFLDNLFDSLNVTTRSKPEAKPLKTCCTKKSPHRDFWLDALKTVETMKFYCQVKKKFVSIPTLKNLKFTISGLLYLTDTLLSIHDFKYVLTGAFNQDPIENFFSYIRSHGFRNINPSVYHFIASFKTLITNNFMAAHSSQSNCEKDQCEEALDDLRGFLSGATGISENVELSKASYTRCTVPRSIILRKQTRISKSVVTYISGYIAKCILKRNKCEACKSNLLIRDGSAMTDDVIEARQFDRARLIKPGNYLNFLISNSLSYLFYLIPRICEKDYLSEILALTLKKQLNFAVINCSHHNLADKVCKSIIRCTLFWWCRSVNKIAKGLDSKFNMFLNRNPDPNMIDPVKLQAKKKYEARRKLKKK